MYIGRALRKIIDLYRGKSIITPKDIIHREYGKIYYPYYDLYNAFDKNGEDDVYNEFGEKLNRYFIRDIHTAFQPNKRGRYILFDRYDFGLKTHFYSHNCMLETMGNPDRRYGYLIESESICPEDYKIFEKHKGLEKDFDLIFTYSDEILNKVDNARFIQFFAVPFGDVESQIDSENYKKKTKNVSILSSNKAMYEMHKLRQDLAFYCKRNNLADTYGTFDGGAYIPFSHCLKDYRYFISIENDIKPYFFTDKIVSALLLHTIPIYLGATKIDKFFNPDGIIQITKDSNIEEVLKQCTEEEYNNRLPAIIDNYNRALYYCQSPFDIIYKDYLNKG